MINDEFTENMISPEKALTLAGLFAERVHRSADSIAYCSFDKQVSQWRDLTWQQMADRVASWQAAMLAKGLLAGERIALMLPNGPEWVAIDQAALGLGLVVVPLYVNDRGNNIAYILDDSEARLLVISDELQWQELLPHIDERQALKNTVCLEKANFGKTALGQLPCYVGDFLPAGQQTLRTDIDDPHSLATIVYTSGTTGRPKGVMLSHRNILSNALSCYRCVAINEEDVFLSFLPLSHALERTVGYYLPMMTGAKVSFARSIPDLGEDLLTQRPTVIISVPRIYERIYGRVLDQLEEKPAFARKLFDAAVSVGWQRFLYHQGRASWLPALLCWPLLAHLVANKVLARLGGRLRIAICGGAPLPPRIGETFIALGLPLLQGYGMTEASPVASANHPDDNIPTSVGTPLDGVEASLGENGELLIRGDNVMLGYWRNDQATSETIDESGWLHTGDKASLGVRGHITITGRLKEIIVLSNGEKVSPADMEMAIAMDTVIDQVLVFGEQRPYLVALIVVEPKHWLDLTSDIDSLAQQEFLVHRIAERLYQFPGYAQVRRVCICAQPWTVENGLLTPTLKLRRAQIEEQYSHQIEELYLGH